MEVEANSFFFTTAKSKRNYENPVAAANTRLEVTRVHALEYLTAKMCIARNPRTVADVVFSLKKSSSWLS